MDWKLELVAVPVSDVDRAKAFYTEQVGFNADHDHQVSDEMRFVQLTPPGSACSIAIGSGIMDTPPGSVQGLQLVVADVEAARAQLVERGVEVSEVQDFPWGRFVFFSDPDGNGWAVQAIPKRELAEMPAAALEAGERATCPIERAPAAAHAQPQRPGEVLGRPVVQAPALARHGTGSRCGATPSAWRLDLDAAAGQAPAALVDGDPQRAQRAHDGAHLVADGDDQRRRRRRAAARARRDRRRRRRTRRGGRSRAPGPTTTPAACRPRPSSSRRRRRRRRGRSSRAPTRALPLTRARSSHGCQYWLRPGTACAGPSAPNARRGHASGVGEADLQPCVGTEVDAQRALVGGERVAGAQRAARAARPTRRAAWPSAPRRPGWAASEAMAHGRPSRVAADGEDDDHDGAGPRLGDAPEVALHADAVIAARVAEGRVGAGGAVGGQHWRRMVARGG